MRNLVLKLIQKNFLAVNTTIKPGDLVSPVGNDDVVFDAIGIYYNFYLKPFLFVRDNNGYIFSGPPDHYKRATKMDQLTLFP
jgi:hypothetical protein